MPTPSPSRKPSLHPQHKVFSIPIPPELNPTSHKPNLEVAVASDNHSGSWDYSLVCADYGDWRWGLGDKVAEISEPGVSKQLLQLLQEGDWERRVVELTGTHFTLRTQQCRGKGMETYKGEYALWHEGHDWIMVRCEEAFRSDSSKSTRASSSLTSRLHHHQSRGGGWMTTMPWIRSACEGKVMIDVYVKTVLDSLLSSIRTDTARLPRHLTAS